MQITPVQAAILAATTFVGVLALSVLAKYRSDETFRNNLNSMSLTERLKKRDDWVAQEHMVAAAPYSGPAIIDQPTGDDSDDDE